jgi:hypothetical protein
MKMMQFAGRAPKELLMKAREKAGFIPLSVILRKLLEKWVNGEIVLDLKRGE